MLDVRLAQQEETVAAALAKLAIAAGALAEEGREAPMRYRISSRPI